MDLLQGANDLQYANHDWISLRGFGMDA